MNSTAENRNSGDNSNKLVRVVGLLVLGLFAVFLSNSMETSSLEGRARVGVQIKNFTRDEGQPETSQGEDDDSPSLTTTADAHTRRTYVLRGRAHVFDNNETRRQALVEEWGSWTLVDEKEKDRPQNDFYAAYPHRDVPRHEFPKNAWQIDAEFLAKFLPQSIQLVERVQKAIMVEYGQDPLNSTMFQIFRYNSSEVAAVTESGNRQGGWTTDASWQGLIKRILHAIMTEDVFVFAMGGHSAAAGHGNHFQQSYMLQIQWILESVFARMGVQFVARNFGNGGLGTVHNGIAAGDIYGQDVDMLMWDSGMTEKNNRDIELMHRQGLLASPHKIPVLWTQSARIAREYNQAAGVEIGIPGSGMQGIGKCSTFEELMSQPYAGRYLKCSGAANSICKNNRYDGVCWIDRPDVTPTTQQSNAPGGRASWHPGNREHQLFGRVLTYTILEATKDALNLWKETDGLLLNDEAWHMTAHYEGLRKRVEEIPLEKYHCLNYGEMNFFCRYPMKARTEFTPRAFPSLTNIRTLMPPEMLANINDSERPIYNPPDIFNPSLHPPEGEIDVLSIVESGVAFRPILAPTWATGVYKMPTFAKPPHVPVGKGFVLQTKSGDEFCDGSLDSFCSRGNGESCLLKAHNDGRNGFLFDGLSGWMVLNVPDLLHGHIVIKLETWHESGSVWKTEGWVGVNNETTSNRDLHEKESISDVYHSSNDLTTPLVNQSTSSFSSSSDKRRLKKKPPQLAANFKFQYAINGNITTMDKATFLEKKKDLARVVETVVLLDDQNFTGGVETEVEVAFRIIGCGRQNTFKMSHIYWA